MKFRLIIALEFNDIVENAESDVLEFFLCECFLLVFFVCFFF